MNSDGKKQSNASKTLDDDDSTYAPLNQLLFGVEQIISQVINYIK
jgi:hypothetical protein